MLSRSKLTDLTIKVNVADVVDHTGSAMQECGAEEEDGHDDAKLSPIWTLVTSAEDEAPCYDSRQKASKDTRRSRFLPEGQKRWVDPAGNLCILASSQ